MERLRSAGLYFLLVFAAGFVLGTVRVLFVVPALGVRTAELLELPLMLVIVAWVARFLTRRRPAAAIGGDAYWLQVGAIACALMLLTDVGVGVCLRGMSVWQALFARDPLAGTAYYLALGFLAVAPRWFARRPRS
jgi:hypothetical protein